MPTRILVIDDSKVIRTALEKELSREFDLFVVDVAADPFEASEKIRQHRPDVLTLDIEMPRMDGLTFLKSLMKTNPMPVVVFSSLAQPGSLVAIEALRLGAAEVVVKPKNTEEYQGSIASLVRALRKAKQIHADRLRRQVQLLNQKKTLLVNHLQTSKLLVIGASTGGATALELILRRFPNDAPPTVVVQHMPPHFTRLFAERLNSLCAVHISEAQDGEELQNGRVLIAPGAQHLEVVRRGTRIYASLSDAPPVCFHRPSADVLFRSVANHCGADAVGVLLTGLGKDGAEGLLEMKSQGAQTIVQNPQTAVCTGMPDSAIALNAASEIVDLEDIASTVLALAEHRSENETEAA